MIDRKAKLKSAQGAVNSGYYTDEQWLLVELEVENARLREEAPDYERLKRAEALADSEYVGQAWKPLWQWAWEQTALEGGDGS